jgi:hypothetical protein
MGQATAGSARRLLSDGAAELQGLIPLLAAACREKDDGAEKRHHSNFLGTHDCTSKLSRS